MGGTYEAGSSSFSPSPPATAPFLFFSFSVNKDGWSESFPLLSTFFLVFPGSPLFSPLSLAKMAVEGHETTVTCLFFLITCFSPCEAPKAPFFFFPFPFPPLRQCRGYGCPAYSSFFFFFDELPLPLASVTNPDTVFFFFSGMRALFFSFFPQTGLPHVLLFLFFFFPVRLGRRKAGGR